MTLDKFIAESGLAAFEELEKVLYFAFYYLKKESMTDFSAADAAKWVHANGMGNPNSSRLGKHLQSSGDTIKGSKQGHFRLHHNFLKQLEAKFPQLSEKSQDVEDDGTILPQILYGATRGFIESLAKQINRSYEENIYDGCAVLMRRLEEVLLILSYQHLHMDNVIKDGNGNYFLLERIVTDAVGNQTLKLSRNTKEHVETFRKLGNYSAHSITYTCKRQAIKEKIDDFRYMVEELLHKAGLRT